MFRGLVTAWAVVATVALVAVGFELHATRGALAAVLAARTAAASTAAEAGRAEPSAEQIQWERERGDLQCKWTAEIAGPDAARKCRERLARASTSPPSRK